MPILSKSAAFRPWKDASFSSVPIRRRRKVRTCQDAARPRSLEHRADGSLPEPPRVPRAAGRSTRSRAWAASASATASSLHTTWPPRPCFGRGGQRASVLSAGRAGRRGGPRAGCDDALRQPPCRRPRRLVRPGGRRVLPACLYVLGLAACHAPTLSVSSSASIAASSAWVWMRPSATSWPPDRRTAEANGPAQVFS